MRKKEQQEIIQIMNILFFLTPKEDVAHVDEDDTMRQVLEKMEHHGYTAIPLLSREGKYIGTITEGDLLWFLKDRNFPDLKLLEDMPDPCPAHRSPARRLFFQGMPEYLFSSQYR